MKTIKINESTYKRLQSIGKTFEDSVDSVINKLIDSYQQNNREGLKIPRGGKNEPPLRKINPDQLSVLQFSKILSATIDGKPDATNWNKLMRNVISASVNKTNDRNWDHYFKMNIKEGEFNQKNYTYLPDLDITVQGQNAENACKAIRAFAKKAELSIEIKFRWQDIDKASYPGECGILRLWR